jgi:hypothetical protein
MVFAGRGDDCKDVLALSLGHQHTEQVVGKTQLAQFGDQRQDGDGCRDGSRQPASQREDQESKQDQAAAYQVGQEDGLSALEGLEDRFQTGLFELLEGIFRSLALTRPGGPIPTEMALMCSNQVDILGWAEMGSFI